LAVAAVAALETSFVAGMAVAGGTTATPPTGPGTPPPLTAPLRLANADLRLPGSCDALLVSYVERGVERVGPYGWDSPVYYDAEDGGFLSGADGEAVVGGGVVALTLEKPLNGRRLSDVSLENVRLLWRRT
jgi:hypothetical protein